MTIEELLFVGLPVYFIAPAETRYVVRRGQVIDMLQNRSAVELLSLDGQKYFRTLRQVFLEHEDAVEYWFRNNGRRL